MLAGQSRLVSDIDARGFAAAWVRDIPLYDPRFGDAGQLFDPFTYLAYLAARTQRISLATGSAIFLAAPPHRPRQIRRHHRPTLRRPPRHGHRLRRPSHRVPRLRPATRPARRALRPGGGRLPPPAPTRPSRPDLAARPHHRRRTPAQPAAGPIPLLVTGASGQSPDWIAAHADGWLTYPGSSVVPAGPKVLGQKIQAWRDRIPDGGFRPHATNEWIDLVDDPAHPPTLLHGGFILQIGRHALIDLLSQWQTAGVNHVALGIQFSRRPAAEAIQELAEEVLPRFPSHEDVPPLDMDW